MIRKIWEFILIRLKVDLNFDSGKYWEERYALMGENSGMGSYGRLAQFKAETINDFVAENNIRTVIEFGHGDGNQLTLAKYPQYLGFDVSDTAVAHCRKKFAGDASKEFRNVSEYKGETAELTLSLDVIYHLVEDAVFENYMRTLFDASTRFVIVYACDKDGKQWAKHVRLRKFTDWANENAPGWRLLKVIPNKYPALFGIYSGKNRSFADFYIFEKK